MLVERIKAVVAKIKTDISGKVSKAGDTLTGKLITKISNATSASLNIPVGVAPSAPVKGDVYRTSAGIRHINDSSQDVLLYDTGNLSWASLGYTPVQQGTGVGQTGNAVKIGWSGAAKLKATVDNGDLGNIAFEDWVSQQIANLVASSPATLDTLNELATALGNDANFATTMTNALAGKASLTGASFSGQVFVSKTGQAEVGVVSTGQPATFIYNSDSGFGFYDNGIGSIISYIRADGKKYLFEIDISTLVLNNSGTYSINISGSAMALDPSRNYQVTSLGAGTAAPGGGEIRATGDIRGFFSSDKRLKENIRNIENPLELISRINGVRFDWTASYIEEAGGVDGYFVKKEDVGVIAQEIEAILPEIVSTRKDGTKAVKYDRLVALLIESTKELHKEVNYLKERLCKIEEAE